MLPIVLRAGPLTALFEPEIGFLRYVRLGSLEIIRGIYGAARGPEWETPAPEISGLSVDARADSFEVCFTARCRTESGDFLWETIITGEPDGSICYAFTGEALRSLRTSRTGLCLLHPVRECAGRACEVEHTDGTVQPSVFPELISPYQPFFDIRAITHEILPGLRARIELEGDTFEMEDQRNWTDASFKTYCRPLSLPRPYEVAAGEVVAQSITLRLQGDLPTMPAEAAEVRVTMGKSRSPLPAIGFGVGEKEPRLVPDWLYLTHPAHLRVDLQPTGLTRDELEQRLLGAEWASLILRAGLEVAIFLTDAAVRELSLAAEVLSELHVSRVLIFHATERATPERLLWLAREILPEHLGPVPIGGGTNLNLTDLNRRTPPVAALDFACFPATPQVHAFDDRTLVENLEGQGHAVRTARALVPDRPVSVSPVTLRPRFNAEAANWAECDPALAIDPRQRSLFTAGWTLGSLHQLSAAGAAGITYFELEGDRGIVDAEGVFPVFHVLADVGECAGGEVIEIESSHPLEVECLALRHPEGAVRVLVANLTGEPREVRLLLPAHAGSLRVLEAPNTEALRDPVTFRKQPGTEISIPEDGLRLELSPYAVARIDLQGRVD